MKLSGQSATRFYELMWGLQYFVNQSLDIYPDIVDVGEYGLLPQSEKLPVRDALYEHSELIDQYVAQNPDNFRDDDLRTISSWKNSVRGDFYIERMLKKHTIFIGGNAVYGVLAIFDAFDELFDKSMLPVYVKAVLLPFEGQIIYDGLMQGYNVFFGGGIKGDLKETYMAAKQNRRIITSLDEDAGNADQPQVELRDWSPEIDEIKKFAKRLRSSKDAPATWSPAFALLRAGIELAEASALKPDDIGEQWDKLEKVERALRRMETVLYRAD